MSECNRGGDVAEWMVKYPRGADEQMFKVLMVDSAHPHLSFVKL